MMSATSRRRFLSSAAAVAAAATAACGGGNIPTPEPRNSSATPPANTPPQGTPLPDSDERAATGFLSDPKFLDPNLDTTPKLSMLMYGLVCVDFGDQELLIPNTANLSAHDVHSHRARLWVAGAGVQTGSAAATGKVTYDAAEYFFWDINNRAVKVDALDSAGNVVASTSSALAPRNSPLHPWTDWKWVRCLKDVSTKPILPVGSRNNPALIVSRVDMKYGAVTAIPPSTVRGQLTQWKVTYESGVQKAHATTDAMVWQRAYGPVTAFKISLTPIPSGTASEIKVAASSLLAAVTCAMPNMPMANPNKLTDTRAFAQLLVGGNVSTHPTPDADRNLVPTLTGSGSDGHCECGCN